MYATTAQVYAIWLGGNAFVTSDILYSDQLFLTSVLRWVVIADMLKKWIHKKGLKFEKTEF